VSKVCTLPPLSPTLFHAYTLFLFPLFFIYRSGPFTFDSPFMTRCFPTFSLTPYVGALQTPVFKKDSCLDPCMPTSPSPHSYLFFYPFDCGASPPALSKSILWSHYFQLTRFPNCFKFPHLSAPFPSPLSGPLFSLLYDTASSSAAQIEAMLFFLPDPTSNHTLLFLGLKPLNGNRAWAAIFPPFFLVLCLFWWWGIFI